MKLTDLSIDHFGALSKFSLPEIAAGLNVLHGPNGSGKTTLVQFIRGVFAGFDEARRRQLIPPVGSETAGGTVGIEWGSRRMAVIRHGRPDEYETLAINVRQGQPDEGQSLRKHIEAFDDERLSVLFTAGSFDANSVEALIRLARTDGLDLSTVPGNERPISARLTHLHSQRASLLRHSAPAGRRAELQAQRESIAAEKLAIQRQADERRAELLRARVALDERLAIVDVEIEQLFLEFQALETDLSECESRLWASRQPVLDVVYVQETIPPGLNPRLPEVEELDRRIEHVRTVLKDLAASRHQLSIEAANAAGSDVPDRLAFAARQRESLRVMQMQLHALSGTAQWLESASQQGTCVCETVHERLASVVDEMRRQVELSCQELSRQQTAWQLEQRRADLASLDQTEQGLQRQLNWLRLRREELLDEAAHPTLSRLAHTVTAERQFCGCPEHTATMRATTPRVVTRRTVQERHDQSAAPPEDLANHTALVELKSAARDAWQTAMARSCDLELQRRRLISAFHAIDIAPALADCEHRLAAIQQQLDELDAQLAELAALDAEIRTLESQIVRDQSSRLISEASGNLELLTLGRYRALRIGTDGMTLQVIGENDSPYVASALSRGTLFQVALVLRIALVDEYARRGLEFPLVLDDVLVDSDEHRLEAAAQLLSAAAERGRQILFLTCQDHLVDMLEDRGAAVHSLPGSIRTQGPRSPFIPSQPIVQSLPPAVRPEPPALIPVPASPAAMEPVALPGAIGPGSPILIVPSLSSHFASRLNAEGVHTLGQLADLDHDAEPALISRLGATRVDFATWKAESALLIGIAGLSSDDARLLAAVGVRHRDDLRRFTNDSLWQRIQRFRGSTPQPWHAWIRDRNSWPREEEIHAWIRAAHEPARDIVAFTSSIAQSESDDDGPEGDDPQPAGEQDLAFRKRTRRSRRSRFAAGSSARPRGSASASADEALRYFLTLDSAIVDAPSIGPKTARMLNRAGVQTVAHLLQRSAAELAENISDRSITADIITSWQQQSRLMCELPNLRGHDAQLLVACGFTSLETLATTTAGEVHAAVAPFAESKAGQRILRSSTAPDRAEIISWGENAAQQWQRRAA